MCNLFLPTMILILFSFSSFADAIAPFIGYCDGDAYGTTTNGPNGDSSLLTISLSDGTGTTVETLTGNGIHRVTAIEFSPLLGLLYGVGEDENDVSTLFLINCRSAKALKVGATGIPNGQTITDLSFDKLGQLWGYAHGGNAPDSLGTIDRWSGVFTSVGATGIDIDSGNALTHDINGDIFHGGGIALSMLDKATGAVLSSVPLSFLAPGNDNPRYTALDVDEDGIIYGALNDKPNGQGAAPDNYVVKVNPVDGTMSFLTDPVINAPNRLSGFSINPNN